MGETKLADSAHTLMLQRMQLRQILETLDLSGVAPNPARATSAARHGYRLLDEGDMSVREIVDAHVRYYAEVGKERGCEIPPLEGPPGEAVIRPRREQKQPPNAEWWVGKDPSRSK